MKKGFTLIELLVVIAIIGVLSTIIISSIGNISDRAKIAKTVAEIRQMETDIILYNLDTNTYPHCVFPFCNSTNDPFINSNGVPGWNGPYGNIPLHLRSHAWGGAFTVYRSDFDGDGDLDVALDFNDDAPGTSFGDNTGGIPLSLLHKFDDILDDGVELQGRFRHYSSEGFYIIIEAE